MKKSMWILAVTTTLVLQGCAHTDQDKKVDTQVAQETSINNRADLRAEANKLIQTASGLSQEQRDKLTSLRDSTRAQDDALRAESLKLRAVLIKNLVAKNYSESETNTLKQRIRKLEEQRLSNTFKAVDQANQILGHEDNVDHRHIMDSFFEGPGSRD